MAVRGALSGLTMLISESYRAQNAELHQTKASWGSHVDNFIIQAVTLLRPTSVLDYGCGKRALAQSLGEIVRSYDPAIVEYAEPPVAADVVVCCKVLEHVEPDCLDDVLDDLRRLTLRATVLKITTIPSSVTLPDGRNAHLIVEGANYWLPKLIARWRFVYAEQMRQGLRFIGMG
jgi:hypothetical protein